jgi:ATP-dependent protease ClpP protease subunit
MILSEEAKTLLESHGLFVMPSEIDHEAFKLVVYVCALYAHKPLKFHCAGDGGDTASALGIVDIIREHGNVTGLLAGEANSSSGVIFAGCAHRYIYPYGSIGVHGCAMNQLNTVDVAYARTWMTELETTDRAIAKVFSDASNAPCEFWLEMILRQGGQGYTRHNAQFLIECRMAKPISEMPA